MSGKIEWSEDQQLFLIERVKSKQFLWDPANTGYHLKSRKQLEWQKILSEFNSKFGTEIKYSE